MKIKMIRKVFSCLFCALLGIGNLLYGQDINFQVSAPRAVAIGENFRIVYSVNAEGEKFSAGKNSDNVRILSGPNLSTSSSVQIINGKVSQSMSQSYTFYAVATKEGKIEISPASVEVDGSTYTSDPVNIEAVKGNNTGNAQQSQQQKQMNNTTVPNAEISDKDLFVRVSLSDKEIYQGESTLATIKVYARVDLEGFEDIRYPSFNGFWSEDLDVSSRISLEREVVNGEIYNVGVFKKVLLFPQQSGKLTIDPFELDCVVRQRVKRRRRSNDPFSMFDEFMGGGYQRVLKKVASPAFDVNVKPLPVSTRPSSFHGAVGDIKVTTSVDVTEVKANEPITYKVKISGNGNLHFVDPFKINFPPDFEVYDPKQQNNYKASVNGIAGSKEFEYLLIPRRHGNYTIPSVSFSWFNPSKGAYSTIDTEAYDIEVLKGNQDEVTVLAPNAVKENVRLLGQDIRYIKTSSITLINPTSFFVGSGSFYAAYFVPLLIFTAFLFYARNKRKESENVSLVKNKRAAKLAKKRLQQVEKYLKSNEKDQFYKELLNAFWGYIGDKLLMERASMTKDNVKEKLLEAQVPDAQVDQFLSFMDECEFAQFSPDKNASLQKIYDQAVTHIATLESKIQSKVTA